MDDYAISNLSNLESFDPAAFEANSIVSQDVCNFVLTLALIYNDLKDVIYAHEMLKTQEPVGFFKISRQWGAYSGIKLHLLRMMIGLFHEFVKLMEKSSKVTQDPFFQSVLSHINKNKRKIWSDMVSIAQQRPANTRMGHLPSS